VVCSRLPSNSLDPAAGDSRYNYFFPAGSIANSD
jgi:hypothetical protein